MRTATRCLRTLAVSLACVGWILPMTPSQVRAAEHTAASPARPMVHDLKLDQRNAFQGQLLNAAGQPLVDQALTLRTNGELVAQTKTDESGLFHFGDLRGGVYQIGIADAVVTCRVWTANAAPPAAKEQMLIVAGSEEIVRGQQPIGAIFTNPLVIGVVVAAAIAVPLVVHNNSDEKPPGS